MHTNVIKELDRLFGIPAIAKIVEGNGGLAKIVVTTPKAIGEVYFHGAHVTSWQPAGAEEVLFVSVKSLWETNRPIRGGIPVCFPWFADKANDPHSPAHGFLRTAEWQLDSIVMLGDAVSVSLRAESNKETKKWWPADFQVI